MFIIQQGGIQKRGIIVDLGGGLSLGETAEGFPQINTTGGSPALNDLTDVTITAPTTGQYLRFVSGQWVNSVLIAGDLPTHTHVVADIISGTFARSFLPTQVAYEDEANTFTLLQTFAGGVSIPIGDTIAFVAGGGGTGIDMQNRDIALVNNLTFSDPGPNEGLSWLGGNLWKIYESPNDLTTNSLGNLQFVQNATRRMTLNTSGQLELPITTGTAPFLIASTTLVANLNADLLDGQQGSFYQNADNLNAGNVPYARLPTGTGGWSPGSAAVVTLTAGQLTVAGSASNNGKLTANRVIVPVGTDLWAT